MSFTLMRNKNGREVPLKLSIWDAFKGVPLPKPRPHKCRCCKQVHQSGNKANLAQVANVESQKKNEDSQANNKNTQDQQPKEGAVFTAEEDAKLLEMKGEGKSWAFIETEMKKPKDSLKARWKDLNPANKGGDDKVTKVEDAKSEPKKEIPDANEANQNPQQAKMSKKARKAARAQVDAEEKRKESGAAIEVQAVPDLVPPLLPPPPILPAAVNSNLVAVDEKHRWQEAAAKHYDRTGKRITAEQARKMATTT